MYMWLWGRDCSSMKLYLLSIHLFLVTYLHIIIEILYLMNFGCCLVRMPDVSLCQQNKLWVLFLLGNWEVSVCFLFTWDLNSCILKYIVSWTTGRSWFWTWLDQISRHCSYIQWIAPSPFHYIFRNCFSGATTFKAIVCLFTFWPCFCIDVQNFTGHDFAIWLSSS